MTEHWTPVPVGSKPWEISWVLHRAVWSRLLLGLSFGDCSRAVVPASKVKVRAEPTVTTGAVCVVGAAEGLRVGAALGDLVASESDALGCSFDGVEVGSAVGSTVGSVVGSEVGSAVGALVGGREDMYVGESVDRSTGLLVEDDNSVGRSVGVGLLGSTVVITRDGATLVVGPGVGVVVTKSEVGPMDANVTVGFKVGGSDGTAVVGSQVVGVIVGTKIEDSGDVGPALEGATIMGLDVGDPIIGMPVRAVGLELGDSIGIPVVGTELDGVVVEIDVGESSGIPVRFELDGVVVGLELGVSNSGIHVVGTELDGVVVRIDVGESSGIPVRFELGSAVVGLELGVSNSGILVVGIKLDGIDLGLELGDPHGIQVILELGYPNGIVVVPVVEGSDGTAVGLALGTSVDTAVVVINMGYTVGVSEGCIDDTIEVDVFSNTITVLLLFKYSVIFCMFE